MPASRILVTGLSHSSARARLFIGSVVVQCAIGKNGITVRKREGDGKTPAGSFRIAGMLQRLDRLSRFRSGLQAQAITQSAGWCDDAASGRYNRSVAAGAPERHEKLWRADGLYNVVFVIDYNLRPRIIGAGSAIFFHLATEDLKPTEGCVAVRWRDMRRVASMLSRNATIEIR